MPPPPLPPLRPGGQNLLQKIRSVKAHGNKVFEVIADARRETLKNSIRSTSRRVAKRCGAPLQENCRRVPEETESIEGGSSYVHTLLSDRSDVLGKNCKRAG